MHEFLKRTKNERTGDEGGWKGRRTNFPPGFGTKHNGNGNKTARKKRDVVSKEAATFRESDGSSSKLLHLFQYLLSGKRVGEFSVNRHPAAMSRRPPRAQLYERADEKGGVSRRVGVWFILETHF